MRAEVRINQWMGRHPVAALLAIAALAATLPAAGRGDDRGTPAPGPEAGQAAGAGAPSGASRVLAGTLPLLNGAPQDSPSSAARSCWW